MWAFYNASKSGKENIVVQAKAIMQKFSDSIVPSGIVSSAVKDAIDKTINQLDKVDTSSRLAAYLEAAKAKVEETAKETIKSLLVTAVKITTSLFSRLFGRS